MVSTEKDKNRGLRGKKAIRRGAQRQWPNNSQKTERNRVVDARKYHFLSVLVKALILKFNNRGPRVAGKESFFSLHLLLFCRQTRFFSRQSFSGRILACSRDFSRMLQIFLFEP